MLRQANRPLGCLASTGRLSHHVRPLVWLACLLGCAGVARAQDVRYDLYSTDGAVLATARSGNTLYLGGEFTSVGYVAGGGVPLRTASGERVSGFPKVDGFVSAVVPDGSGGWFIGGRFTAVGGFPRTNLAHILADSRVSAWNPGADGEVVSMVRVGSTIYLAGSFSNVGGESRYQVAALDAATGQATAWQPLTYSVRTLAASGSTIYLGGNFQTVNSELRNGLAAVDATTGVPTPWNPNPNGGGNATIDAIAVDGTTVYVGGFFDSIGGATRHNAAALDASTGLATAWSPNATGDQAYVAVIYSLAVNGTTVYAAGGFSNIGGRPRRGLAALDAVTGAATDWNPNPNGAMGRIVLDRGTLYASGQFTTIGGQPRTGLAALDAVTGAATAWNPKLIGAGPLATNGAVLYVGGFISFDVQPRHHLAAIDVRTGRPTAWSPDPDGNVTALAVNGSQVQVAGTFSNIGGGARHFLASVEAGTGLATAWNPDPNGVVSTLASNGGTIYAGGYFTRIGGQPRNRLAAFDAATGLATPWNPNVDGGVTELAANGNTVYAGGYFTGIGAETRNLVAAIDASTGIATAWNPDPDSYAVLALALSGNTVYVGGTFSTIGGRPRRGLAALDASTALTTPWDPGADAPVHALAVVGPTVYAGGEFAQIGGQPRRHIAALDAVTGVVEEWDAPTDGDVLALAADRTWVYAGGRFTSVGHRPERFLAAVATVPPANRAPDVGAARASTSRLWPPDHRMVRIRIEGVTDPDGDRIRVAVTGVTQDEPLVGRGSEDEDEDAAARAFAPDLDPGDAPDEALDASIESNLEPIAGTEADRDDDVLDHGERDRKKCPDATIDESGRVALRAERLEHGNGRVYEISFTATDEHGGSSNGTVRVCVPRHEHGRHGGCKDDGQRYNSLGPCSDGDGDHRHRDAAVQPDVLEGTLTLSSSASHAGEASVQYGLPADGDVDLAVFDVAGRRVATLFQGHQVKGTHPLSWNTSGLARGMYFYRLRSRSAVRSKALLILH